MGQIASNVGVAIGAVSGLQGVTTSSSVKVSLSQSNIDGMTEGVEINNQLLSDLEQLVECVKMQSEKFPKIAEAMAVEDSKITF